MSLGLDEKKSTHLLQTAYDHGINFFDTADLYDKGQNEILVGKALKDIRQQVIIATKVGNQWRPDGSGWDWNPTKSYIKKAVVESLRRLQTDYIDLYQLHGGTIDDPIDETIEAFEELKRAGHIRHYGISSIRPNVIREYLDRSNMVSIMMQYSLLDRRPEETCLDLIHKKGCSVIVRGGVAKGLLANKPARTYLEHDSIAVAVAQKLLNELKGDNRTAGQLALQFCKSHSAVATIACGVSKEAQLLENIGAGDLPDLELEVLEKLKKEVKAAVYEKHR